MRSLLAILAIHELTKGFVACACVLQVPTANLPPEPLVDAIESLPNGVYFGWAQLVGGAGSDGDVHKMVMNIGQRPTCEDGGGRTVEVHVLHSYGGDFYGERMKALAMGYLRWAAQPHRNPSSSCEQRTAGRVPGLRQRSFMERANCYYLVHHLASRVGEGADCLRSSSRIA